MIRPAREVAHALGCAGWKGEHGKDCDAATAAIEADRRAVVEAACAIVGPAAQYADIKARIRALIPKEDSRG